MNKELKYRAICPICSKAFDSRNEGFLIRGRLHCADCYHQQKRIERLLGKK